MYRAAIFPLRFFQRVYQSKIRMGSAIYFSKTYHIRVAGERLTVHKKNGESYEHVLMKVLGYAMFRPLYPRLEVEKRIGLRYKPDLIALDDQGKAEFWGECGHVGLRKVVWLAKHRGARQIALFKFDILAKHFIEQVREEVEPRYRPPSRIRLFNFDSVVAKEAPEEVHGIPEHWYECYEI
jgi:hypothetical protein